MSNSAAIARCAAEARSRGRARLTEPQCAPILEELGIRVPRHVFVSRSADLTPDRLDGMPGTRVVVKAHGPELAHRSEVGAVAVVDNTFDSIVAAIRGMERGLKGVDPDGYGVHEHILHRPDFGEELLVSVRWTRDCGPVVALGPGGVHTELLSRAMRPGEGLSLVSPGLARQAQLERVLSLNVAARAATGQARAGTGSVERDRLCALLDRMLDFAAGSVPDPIAELEINPLVFHEGEPVALDALCRLGQAGETTAPRPVARLRALLRPDRIAIVGVSRRANPGRVILENTLREGFPADRIHVIKPGVSDVLGCRAVPGIASLPHPVDLLVVAVAASDVPRIVDESVASGKVESLIVIPGGMGESEGTGDLVDDVRATLDRSRETAHGGPVVNGGNCLGIRSAPGRYNTLFLPPAKLPLAPGGDSPLALISQSGAFAASRLSRLGDASPRYVISLGNQIDLTMGDYLAHLSDDPELQVFACYIEGFRTLDGLRWLQAAEKIVAAGKTVLLYRAGRSADGARASASHTASVAGEYEVTRELAAGAGVTVADTLDDFLDLTRLFTCLRGREPRGLRLGAISNAGYECVAIGDRSGELTLDAFAATTEQRLRSLLAEARLEGIVGVHNPLDVTPMAGDETFVEAMRIVLDDESVDAGMFGCVPLTPALDTLAAGQGHDEDVEREESVAGRMVRLFRCTDKPWVAVVDAGTAYDAMAARLDRGGIPTFRSADRAMQLLGAYCRARIAARRVIPARP